MFVPFVTQITSGFIVKTGHVRSPTTSIVKTGHVRSPTTPIVKTGHVRSRTTSIVKAGHVRSRTTSIVKTGHVRSRTTSIVKAGHVRSPTTSRPTAFLWCLGPDLLELSSGMLSNSKSTDYPSKLRLTDCFRTMSRCTFQLNMT